VVGEFFKRFMNGVVVLLAALSFFLVPVGKKTTAQHIVAIFSTRPAREAAASFSGVARRIAAQLAVEVEKLQDAHAKPPQSKPAPGPARPPS
jgi:hypothetical protein